jgi:hypothetical protein
MLNFKLNNFGIRERNWSEEEQNQKEKLIMSSNLADAKVKNEIALGRVQYNQFHRLGMFTGGIFGLLMFVSPVVRRQSIFVRMPVSFANGYLAYCFLESYGKEIRRSSIYRAWINMIAFNGLHDQIHA